MNAPLSFSALLLAGGRSRRMGRDKALLEWDGQPLWRVQVAKLGALEPARLMIACREEQGLHQAAAPALEVEDWLFDPPGEDRGPIGAIVRALERAPMPLLVLPVDAPRVNTAWLRGALLSKSDNDRGLFFEGSHGYEPLIALYVPAMLPILHAALQRGDFSLQRVVEAAMKAGVAVTKRSSPADAVIFQAANTPEEWECQVEGANIAK